MRDDAGTRLERTGEACLLAVGVAALSAVPTALRTARAGGSPLDGLLIATALLVPLVSIAVLLLRAADRGFRALAGRSPQRSLVLGLALWIALAALGLAVLGAGLKATTNHRGLGGTTFGVLGVAVVAGTAVVAHRLVKAGTALVERGVRPGAVAALGALVTVAPLLLVGFLASASGGPAAGGARSAILDGLIAAVAIALGASVDLRARAGRRAMVAGAPALAAVLFAGVLRLEGSPAAATALRSGGGLAATVLGALTAWSDRDADGHGAHFGGRDCDEGDPARHPGATEIPGDGIDQDCDDVDPESLAALARPAVVTTATPAAPAQPAAATSQAAAPAGSAWPPPSAAPAARPERALDAIVLVTLDTVRADHTSAYGYERDTTPALAALAARGMLFVNAYAPASDTQRALTPIVSGRRMSRTARDRREWPTIFPENDTVAERMQRAGWRTAAVTSFTWLSSDRGFSQGFDRFETAYTEAHPERGVTGAIAIGMARKVLDDLAKDDRPLFLWVHLFDAHERYLEHPGIDFGKGRTARYDGEIAFVDRQLAALVEATERSRGSRVAWIVHGSHGEALGDRDIVGHGTELYEDVLRVPLVIAVPNGRQGRYAADAVSTIDVAPTVLALGNAPAEGVEGVSLLSPVQGDDAWRHGPVLARGPRRAAVVEWPLKLVVQERKRRDRILLFDLSNDRAEARDLSSERGDDVRRLTELLTRFDRGESADRGVARVDPTEDE